MQTTILLALLCGLRAVSAFVLQSPVTSIVPSSRRPLPHAAAGVGESRVQDVAAIILAGGVGSRMKANMPKQFLELRGKPVLQHSLELFRSLDGISRIILVIDQQYRDQFKTMQEEEPRLVFADPGIERQNSVFNGLQAVHEGASVVCIHDAARPLVTKECIYQVLRDAEEHGAAVLGVPMKATVKESEDGQFVLRTIDRSRLWEIQTPQVIKPALLREGFERVEQEKLEVTDDVSIIEQLGLPVKLTMGEYTNLKLTTPDDMVVAEQILKSRDAL
ncbi:2-C-methyl-D-erythritol 4-phosphate cytidylyltransferase-domain-containing protein [Tribonema minus]|uniref:2-C-methyl-D-erythritol 4-phosphate cytidylyltransferase, chloroplastic n=1 Tax=Tribonema minus TaxID=303371 RepID=A0A835YTP8_9STRA|nr:2-C-methyl-D-erythritol 4-phosphate cytidylyltransferase-domain-containing protein [Tribonema minus]